VLNSDIDFVTAVNVIAETAVIVVAIAIAIAAAVAGGLVVTRW